MRDIFQALSAWFNTSKISDEEFIERLRRTMATLDRWRRRLLVFYVLSAVVLVGLFIVVHLLLTNLMMRLGVQGQNAGFALGFILGLLLGGLAFKVVYGLMDSISAGYRSERLLIRYYDAIQQFNREATALGQESENV